MTATNHVLAGAVIAAAVHQPAIALPLAFLSHFLLDALPHYGDREDPARALARLKWVLPVDSAVALAVLLSLVLLGPLHWQIVVLGGVLGASPDLLQIPRYIRYLRTGNSAPDKDWLSRFHHIIQWGERSWGIFAEIIYAGILLVLLAKTLVV